MSKAEFIAHVERDFVPVLREAGFDGQGLCWRRLREPFIDCVDIQSRSDDAACCVNLGEHLTFLPIAGGSSAPDNEAMTSVDCEIKERLAPDGKPEHWWKFENAAEEVAVLLNCFKARAQTFFGKYRDFPKPFIDMKMSDIESDAALRIMPMMTKVRRILLIARIFDHLGDGPTALEWAEFGKENAGMAVEPKVAFREIIRKYN